MVERGRAAADSVNFHDHTDGELARIGGKTSRIGHLYDLASDAAVTILLFIASASASRHSTARRH